MKIKHLLIGLLAMSAAVACKQDEPVQEPKLDVDKTAVTLQATAGEATFAVTSNQNWVATADADWVSMDPASGAASEKAVTVKVTADDNTTTEARTATVTVKAGALTKTVAVTQAAGAGETPENPEKPELTASDWAIVGSFTGGWNPAEGISLYVLDENYFVLYGLELAEGAQWKFLQGGSWGGAEVGADRTSVEPNTIQAKGGTNIYVNTPGKYDIYLAADATKYYVMSEGKTPAEATEPSAAVKTYTVTGTIQNSNWDNMGAAGLMTKEGDYYVAKNVPFVTAKELYGGADQLEFKVCNTGSWDGAYGAPDAAPYQVNAEIPVQTENAQNIAVAAAAGSYDVYFDEANAKVWVMETGFKPGEKEPVAPEAPADVDIDGKQWLFTWQAMGGASCVIDLGVTEPGLAILAYDMGILDPSYAGIVYPYMMGPYTVTKTDGTSGVVTLTDVTYGVTVDIPYSNATETSVHFATAALLEEDVDCTLATTKVDIYLEATEYLADGEYWIIADGKVATPLASNYGYLQVVDAVDGKSYAANAFKFTQVEAGLYTIQDANGKYYYQTGTYNSFNVSDKDGGTDEYLWEVYDTGNGQYAIINCGVGKFVQYDASYNSYGSYAEEKGTLPTLVLAENPIPEPEPEPEPEPTPTPEGASYVKVTADQDDWSGNYLIVWGSNAHASLASGAKDLNSTAAVTVENGVIAATDALNSAVMTVTKNGDKYNMTFADGKYFAMQHNGCLLSTTAFDLDFAYTTSGVKVSGYVAAKSATYILYHNSSNGNYYRCYVDKNGQSGYTLPTLYKLSE